MPGDRWDYVATESNVQIRAKQRCQPLVDVAYFGAFGGAGRRAEYAIELHPRLRWRLTRTKRLTTDPYARNVSINAMYVRNAQRTRLYRTE
jgi:hypothetical protein